MNTIESLSSSSESNAHALSNASLDAHFKTDFEWGLSTKESQQRLEKNGPNRLKTRRGKNPFILLLSQFNHPLIYILLVSAGITAAMDGWVDASVIAAVVVVNAVIGFIQEMNALRAIRALSGALSLSASVLREGKRIQIDAEQLVTGDVIILQSGDKVPADLRLFKARELQIDESALTGESVPAEKNEGQLPEDTVLADRSNMAYSSTLVTYGTGLGIVVATGDATEIGRINRLISEAVELETPLTKKIARFSWILMWVILGLSAFTFAVGWWMGEDPLEMFTAAVALAVAAIPEGLPVAVTITLAIGVRRMAKRNAIVRKLPAVETLGSTTIICSDKTGTLTQNEMTVQALYAGGCDYQVSGTGYEPKGDISRTAGGEPELCLGELLKAGLLCNDARLLSEGSHWHIEGDPTEGALLVSAAKFGLHSAQLDQTHPRIDAIPFESAYQFMATLHHLEGHDQKHVYLKGSVESILQRCGGQIGPELDVQTLNKDAIHNKVTELAGQGLRVLAFARGKLNLEAEGLAHEHVEKDLVFLGLQAMIDPPRSEAIHAIAACHQAGIEVKMITGDHIGTAVAIAEKIGLKGPKGVSIHAIDGKTLASLNSIEFEEAARQSAVFARVAPEQKLRLVTTLQSTGAIVAMTGDGVNDAPALRQADIGIAMGITGTEVSKEAAAMVLTDDNFATITSAVEEGRGVYDNLIKFITWAIPTNIGEGLIILLSILLGLQLPILPVQILWLNMSTAVLIGIPIAFEVKERGIMGRPPRPADHPIMTRELLIRTVIVGLLLTIAAFYLFEDELAHGESIEKARTTALNMFTLGEAFYLFNCRSLTHSVFSVGLFSNFWIWIGFISLMAVQCLIIYSPTFNTLFHTAPLQLDEWLRAAGAAFLISLVVATEKMIRLHFKKQQLA